MSTYGYVRVSTKEQNEDRQMIAMGEFGVEEDHIILDKQSGKDFERPGYSPSYEDVAQAAQIAGAIEAAFSIAELPAILESQHDPSPAISDENAVCAIIYTSGTTGDPKGVMLTQKSLMSDTLGACQNAQVTGASLLTLPLHHTFAFTTSVLATPL